MNKVAYDKSLPDAELALGILGAWGDEPAVRKLIDGELSMYADRNQPIWGANVESLARWSAPLVREALLDRIRDGHLTERWFFFLQWFATSDDIELFERLEANTDDGLADLAHSFLRYGRGRSLRRSTRD